MAFGIDAHATPVGGAASPHPGEVRHRAGSLSVRPYPILGGTGGPQRFEIRPLGWWSPNGRLALPGGFAQLGVDLRKIFAAERGSLDPEVVIGCSGQPGRLRLRRAGVIPSRRNTWSHLH